MFFTYERTGQFFARPSQIGQSEMYLSILYSINSIVEQQGIDGVLLMCAIFEALFTALQLVIFHIVFSTTEKKHEFIGGALLWIAVNPIQIIGGFSNLGSLNDVLYLVLLLCPLLSDT